MKISIGFSGAAGTGVNTSGMLLGQLLSSKGYSILGDKEYASIIKGDNNDFFLYISDEYPFITQTIDHFFPFDEYSVTKNSKLYNLKKIHALKDTTIKYKNVYFFGASLKLLGIAREEGEKLLASQFTGDVLNDNVVTMTKGYEYFKTAKYDLSKNIGPAKSFVFGNEMVGTGAIAAGMNFYSAYPMTPASSLIDVIVEHKEAIFFQGEDEIAVSMAMLGAKFAGKRAMCGTSGGGFALMTESISFSNQAELGGVYILSQRDGPSTGTPTFTGQSDLNYALNASFGDTFPIVLAPSSFEEGYNLIGKALNRSDIYQHPVIFLIDKQLSESYLSIDKTKLISEPILRGKLQINGSEGFKRYELSADGISKVTLPGTENGEFIATSYEHDENGATNEDPIIKKQQQDKRFKKLETFVQQEFTKDFLEEYIRTKNKKNVKYGLIVIKVLQPLDIRLKEFLDTHVKHIKKLIFVEMNTSGQLQELITNKCWLNDKKWNNKVTNIRKYTLYPIFAEDIII
ncbi:MAG: hypothetical protein NT085_03945 [candidate division SR1 bacterium]|nr:hypothetical protein [candidate division SR1 bacterium]